MLIDLRSAWKGAAGAENAKAPAIRLGIWPGALSHEQVAGMRALFPSIEFEFLEDSSHGDRADIDILFVSGDSAAPEQIERTLRRGRLNASTTQIVVVLRNSDLAKTRAAAERCRRCPAHAHQRDRAGALPGAHRLAGQTLARVRTPHRTTGGNLEGGWWRRSDLHCSTSQHDGRGKKRRTGPGVLRGSGYSIRECRTLFRHE